MRGISSRRIRPSLFRITFVLIGFFSSSVVARGATVDGLLATLERELGRSGCREANFTQSYIPAGFATGRGEAGRFLLWSPDRIRFDYAEPAGRGVAISRGLVTLIDPASRTVVRRRLSGDERARYPLFDLVIGKRPEGYRLSVSGPANEPVLEAVPLTPSDDLVWGAVTLSRGGKSVRRVEWKDVEGNLNRFDLDPLRLFESCSDATFVPQPPAGFRLDDESAGKEH